MSSTDQPKPETTLDAAPARRAFLSKAGKVALAMPPATSLILAATSKPTLAGSPYKDKGKDKGKGKGKDKGKGGG
jgi:hypothetical protein